MEEELSKIIVYVDPEIKEFIPEFLENRKKDIKDMLSLLTKNDFENIRVIGHKMKGSGKLYGFYEISQTGQHLE
ncbi:MAG: Hpt domain-containing protein [Endomicrobia bacterium]|nr:Hpt domain-containing protein [Endomicrobiia bacterium]